ncbi:MAG: hypothetical protein KGR26_01165, partial [Cyanobacteria bacterium REEB65]|nr:hypothetical protein [Cyanobacteria bacterium REEB65]
SSARYGVPQFDSTGAILRGVLMRVSPFGRGAIAATLTLGLLAGCSKPPSASTPTPGSNVTVPVSPSSGLGNSTSPSDVTDSHVAPAPVAAAPGPAVAPPLAVPGPLPAPVGLAAGAPPPLIPFTSYINGAWKLFVYDPTINDNYDLPGAGDNIENPQIFSGNRIVFEREEQNQPYDFWSDPSGNRHEEPIHQIYFYDVVAELVGTFNDVNGLGCVRKPSITYDGTVLSFIHEGRAFIWINGVVADLAKINSVAAMNDAFVTFMRISCDGHWIVFTTSDGGLYVYDVINPMVDQITAARDVGDHCATHPAISPDGTQIAWESGGFVFRYDRVTNLVDNMPFLNTAFNADFVTDPLWECFDNAHIYAELFTGINEFFTGQLEGKIKGDVASTLDSFMANIADDLNSLVDQTGLVLSNPDVSSNALTDLQTLDGCHIKIKDIEACLTRSEERVVSYNWITETVLALTVLNSVAGSGNNAISSIN